MVRLLHGSEGSSKGQALTQQELEQQNESVKESRQGSAHLNGAWVVYKNPRRDTKALSDIYRSRKR